MINISGKSEKKEIKILGIETSCDETSAAITLNGRKILSNIIYSQIDIHKEYGGVVPEVASRNHIKKINYIIQQSLTEANLKLKDIDAIAVTYGPGLVGTLLVGVSIAKALSYSLDIPLIGVNHLDGHISANYLDNDSIEPPFITLVASGGHSHLVLVEEYGIYKVIGQTRDDAAGEAFDKISRSLGLGYPGGPAIDKVAKLGNPLAIEFPRAYLEEDSYDFSFSGLKSSVLNYLNSKSMKNEEIKIEDVAASFQQSVVEVLAHKSIKAAKQYSLQNICLAGGVACNSRLREILLELSNNNNLNLYFPKAKLCTDNAAMIACAGYYKFIKGQVEDIYLNAVPGLKL